MKHIFSGVKSLIKRLVRLGVTGILIVGCIGLDARYIEPRLLITKAESITTTKLLKDTKLRVVLFNDVHLGKYYSLADLKKVVHQMNDLEPDLLIFAGDLIEDNRTYTEEEGATALLAELEARYGKYAVIGNHDHGGNGTKRYRRMMNQSGFTLLEDGHQTIELKSGDKITVIGVDDIVLGKPDFRRAFEGVSPHHFNLFISHAPDVISHILDAPVDLQVSGHSHGGQVRLPFIGAPFTVPYGSEYIKGLYTPKEKTDMQLYVNVGLGTSQVPLRFFNPPEITVFDIEGEAI